MLAKLKEDITKFKFRSPYSSAANTAANTPTNRSRANSMDDETIQLREMHILESLTATGFINDSFYRVRESRIDKRKIKPVL